MFILLSSKEQKREYKEFSYLQITNIINIILVGLIFFIPLVSISTPYSHDEESIFVAIRIIRSLVFFIPQIITLGLIFILIGRKYKEKIGKYLMYSGVFWFIYFSWAAISLCTPDLTNPTLPSLISFLGIWDVPLYDIIFQVLNISSFIYIIAIIFFMVHSYFNSDRNLKIAGYIYIIGRSLMGLGLIPYFLIRW